MDSGRATDTDDDADPAIARVRRELARLGRDDASAPEAPVEVTARIGAVLREARVPAHALARPQLRRWQAIALIVGIGAVLVAAAVGTSMLMRQPAPRYPAGPTAEKITVSRPPFPLTSAEIMALLAAQPDYGPLTDAQRRASCLEAMGYRPSTPVLGAQTITGAQGPGVVLVLPGDSPGTLAALLVGPDCSEARADTVVRRP